MARRDPFSRWNRLPPVYRSGEHKIPGPEDEPQRIILYLEGGLLDAAEALAEKTGFATVQEYCADLLGKAIEVERVKHHVADLEARKGTLEGFHAIASDAGYLAEWQQQSASREPAEDGEVPDRPRAERPIPEVLVPGEILESVALPEGGSEEPQTDPMAPPGGPQVVPVPRGPAIRVCPASSSDGPILPERMIPEVLDGSSISVLWSHIGPGHDRPDGFLPALRKGQSVPFAQVAELLEALRRIEADHRDATALDRSLTYALHRLSLESQVLLTEAWPGVFDDPTVGAIRAVQEMVERILAGPVLREFQSGEGAASETQT